MTEEKYRLLRRLGRGGSCEVYLAEDMRLHKLWALKKIKKEKACLTKQYLKEAELMKRWNHPFLPRIVDVYEEEHAICIVMDYVEGETLKHLLGRHGVFSEEQVLLWAKQLAAVLAYLHGQTPPVIYRDMKPENIMITEEGFIKLIDFGVSRQFVKNRLSDTECLGTAGYAAPEQYGGCGQSDERTDIYGLGIVLYELLTGKNLKEPPYEALPVRSLRPIISESTERIVWKCTRRDPKARYQSCRELLEDLEHPQRKRKFCGKKVVAAFLALLLSFLAGCTAARCGIF